MVQRAGRQADTVACHFSVDIYAPQGLRGVEAYLADCGLALEGHESGYNGKIILRTRPGSDLEWSMDPSDDAFPFASGSIEGSAGAAEVRLRSLSAALGKARFPHRILVDDSSGERHATIEHAWPPDEAA